MPSLKARLILTHKCLGKCWYCFVPKDNLDMSNELIHEIIVRLWIMFNKGVYSRLNVTLTGGDPTLHPKFLDIVKEFQSKFDGKASIRVDICDTADKDIVEEYKKLGGIGVISLNEDPLDSVIKTALSFKQNRNQYFLNVLLTPYNIKRLDDIVSEVIKNNLRMRLNLLYDARDSASFRDTIIPAITKVGIKLIENKYKYYDYFLGFLSLDRLRPDYCGYGKNYYVFHPDGSVGRCQAMKPITHINDPEMERKIKIPEYSWDHDTSNHPVIWNCHYCPDEKYCHGGCESANRYGGYCREYTVALALMKEMKRIRQESNL